VLGEVIWWGGGGGRLLSLGNPAICPALVGPGVPPAPPAVLLAGFCCVLPAVSLGLTSPPPLTLRVKLAAHSATMTAHTMACMVRDVLLIPPCPYPQASAFSGFLLADACVTPGAGRVTPPAQLSLTSPSS